MKPVVLIACVTLFGVGCSHSTEDLREELTTATAANNQLRAEMTEMKTVTEEMREELAKIRQFTTREVANHGTQVKAVLKEWDTFENAYSPDLQKVLAKNIVDARNASEQVAAAADSSQATLAKLRKLTEEVEALKRRCAEHAREAADLNVFGTTKKLAETTHRDLKSVKSKWQRDLESVESDLRTVKRTADDALRAARSAKSRADRAYRRAR